MIQPGASLRIYFDEDTTTEQGFTYRVNYVRLSTTQLEYKPAGDYPDIPGSVAAVQFTHCLLYTSPSPRDRQKSRMPSSA